MSSIPRLVISEQYPNFQRNDNNLKALVSGKFSWVGMIDAIADAYTGVSINQLSTFKVSLD